MQPSEKIEKAMRHMVVNVQSAEEFAALANVPRLNLGATKERAVIDSSLQQGA